MRELVIAAVGFVLQLAVFFCAGSLFMSFLKMKGEAMTAVIAGYLAYFAVFELLAVPMTLLLVPLKMLTAVWAVFMVSVCVLAFVKLHKQWICRLKKFSAGTGKVFREHSGWVLLAIAAVILQCLIVVLYQDNTQDAAYYVGTVSTSVYTGTLGRYNPFTGQAISAFSARYVFSAFPMNNAVWCVITGLPALIQCKIVMSLINVLVANGIIWQTGRQLFGGAKKQADLMVFLVFLLNLYTGTIYTPGTFLFTRFYEGKALLANVAIPMVLLISVCLFRLWSNENELSPTVKGGMCHLSPEERNIWILLFLTAVSAICFSGSAIIFPAVIGAGVLPLLIIKKKPGRIIPCCICMLPCIMYGIAFLCVKYGILSLRAR